MEELKVPSVTFTQLFIGGKFCNATGNQTFVSTNPYTGKVIAEIQEASKEDVDRVVQVAGEAFHKWRNVDAWKRGRVLTRFAELIEKNVETIANLDTMENGVPINEMMHTAHAAAEIFRFYGGLADKIKGDTIPTEDKVMSITVKEPLGVCAIIIPWNSPTLMLAKTVAPALAVGNTVIVKPAEQTSLSALFLASLTTELEVPQGTINVLTGDGKVGSLLAHHLHIDKITFTGSTEVGQSIMAASARSNLKRVTLELGGKSPLVVFDDVDVEKAAELAFASLFVSNGQVCCCGSRTYVQEKIYDRFVEHCAKLARQRVVGNPFRKQTQQGPQVNSESVNKIMRFIESGIKEGARLVTGGQRGVRDLGSLESNGIDNLFIHPTVFADVNESMQIGREEIFGPVQSILKFGNMEEMIERANQTRFGLAAGVLTNDISRAMKFARAVRAGTCWINCYFVVRPQTPFGGYKMSGFGREFGEMAINEYVESKTITINLNESFIFG